MEPIKGYCIRAWDSNGRSAEGMIIVDGPVEGGPTHLHAHSHSAGDESPAQSVYYAAFKQQVGSILICPSSLDPVREVSDRALVSGG